MFPDWFACTVFAFMIIVITQEGIVPKSLFHLSRLEDASKTGDRNKCNNVFFIHLFPSFGGISCLLLYFYFGKKIHFDSSFTLNIFFSSSILCLYITPNKFQEMCCLSLSHSFLARGRVGRMMLMMV